MGSIPDSQALVGKGSSDGLTVSTKTPTKNYLRDKWFLDQRNMEGEETYHSPTKIAKKWNSMSQAERAKICPTSVGKVSTEAVKKAINRARGKSR